MKLYELALTEEEQLNEARLRNALTAAGLAGVAAVSGMSNYERNHPTPAPEPQAHIRQVAPRPSVPPPVAPSVVAPEPTKSEIIAALTKTVLDKYNVSPKLAHKIVATAQKYSHPVFPTATDILSIVGIESSFNPHVVSGLRRDPAVGLMQVRPGVHHLHSHSMSTIDKQIQVGSSILHRYYTRFKSVPAAVKAYNVGETNIAKLKRHALNPMAAIRVKAASNRYLDKFSEERKMYEDL